MMRLPWHLVEAHILPHTGIDTRLAFKVPPGRLDMSGFEAVEKYLRHRADHTVYSELSNLTWIYVYVSPARSFQYRVHDRVRGWDVIDYKHKSVDNLWEDE